MRIAPQLRLFAAPRNRGELITVPYDGTATIGHIAESLGVPLTEIGDLLVDGTSRGPEHQPRPGQTIQLQPVPRPQRLVPRFVLDVHLGKLARRLRLLGIDTAYRNDAADDSLIAQANAEHRVLLTQDRGLLRRRALWSGAYVYGARPPQQLADVLERFAPPLAPWTRCTACNGELTSVPKEDILELIEPGTRRNYDDYARCLECERVYWRGAHDRRISEMIRQARKAHPDYPD